MLNKHNLMIAKIGKKSDKNYAQYVKVNKEKTIVTDGQILVEVTRPETQKDYPEISGFKPASREKEKDFYIGIDEALDIAKSLEKTKIPIFENALISIDDNNIKIAITNTDSNKIFTIPQPDSDFRYPDTDSAMPIEEPKVIFHIDVKLLMQVLAQFESFMKKESVKAIKVEIFDRLKPIKIVAQNDSQRMMALVMPLKIDETEEKSPG
ncbi:MAG: hypothetical protein QXY62_06380 [Candidatus Altiarchaeota archaeon]